MVADDSRCVTVQKKLKRCLNAVLFKPYAVDVGACVIYLANPPNTIVLAVPVLVLLQLDIKMN